MTTDEIKVMRDHIIYLGTQLENERHQSGQKTVLLKRMLDPEDLGHAVSTEVRKLAYQILINDTDNERKQWKTKYSYGQVQRHAGSPALHLYGSLRAYPTNRLVRLRRLVLPSMHWLRSASSPARRLMPTLGSRWRASR